MISALPQSVELLERALGYTRGRLAGVTPARLHAPTPCAGWDLHDLLVHMDDALDAFLEAAGGVVALRARPLEASAADTVTRVQVKACALVGVWTAAARQGVKSIDVGGQPVSSGLLVSTAALEVAVHGWDVGREKERKTTSTQGGGRGGRTSEMVVGDTE
ncbi:MAG: maleylpyruvate isomerase N-terminal domain-containing protein, partial [Nocardioides sp.]